MLATTSSARAALCGREIGEHTFWRGSAWGRTVALQGDSTFTKYDLFVDSGDQLEYWGTFRGNGYYESEESHSFSSPFLWMDRWMAVGDFNEGTVSDSRMDPQLRKTAATANLTLRVEIVSFEPVWQDPDSQISYENVIEMDYTSAGGVVETYHLAEGLGTVRFETNNRDEPSGVWYQYALYFENYTPPDSVTLPWFDPFMNSTFVANGFIADFVGSPGAGEPVTENVVSWDGSSADAVISNDAPDEGTGPWQVALRGLTGGGTGDNTWIIPSAWIPVTPGGTYRLSGSVWRVSESDRVYLDFDDGQGEGQDFPDAEAHAQGTNLWERVSAETTVGAATTGMRVRCVRDIANEGNGYCDGITIQLLN